MTSPAPAEAQVLAVLEQSKSLGFLGPGPVERHVAHSRGFAAALLAAGGGGRALVDLGSGGGIPGLALAATGDWPHVTLVDSSARRCRFLESAVEDLMLGSTVGVVEAQAEQLGRRVEWRQQVPAVVMRSFGPPSCSAECAAPLLAVGGIAVVSDPPDAEEAGDRWPSEALLALGMVREQAGVWEGFHFTCLRQVEPCPDRYPRQPAAVRKRPLF